jgi:hypothetical protein
MAFECALDGAIFEECVAPHAILGLAIGEHQLQVRARDQALNADPTPAEYRWTIETPHTLIYLPLAARSDGWALDR